MNSLSPRKELFFAYFLAAYSAYYLIVSLAVVWGFTTDDAYISWFYARQLANGNGLHWYDALAPVEGYSNFLWMMLAALVIKLQWPLALTMKWFSIFSLGAGLIFLYRLSRLFFSPLLAIVPVFLFSHYIGVVWWTVSGLESAFFCALSVLLMWQCARAFGYVSVSESQIAQTKASTSAWFITNLVLLFLALTRFEGLVWVVPVIFFSCCQLRNYGLSGLAEHQKTVYLWGMITGVCFVLPYTIYFIWRYTYFGHWVPNSYLCKASVVGQIGVVDLDYVRVLISLIVAALPYFLSSKDCRHWLLWLPSVIYAVMLWRADPVLAHLLRLFLGPFALFSILPVLGVYQFLHYFKACKWDLKLITALVMIILTFAFIPGNNFAFLRAFTADYQGRNQNRFAIANMLNTQAAIGATVLLGDCGIIPFNARSDLRFIDSQCLNNSDLTQSPYKNNLEAYADYLQKQVKPDWVVVNKSFSEAPADFLMNLLDKKQFFQEYQLVATYQSGAVLTGASERKRKIVDYVYLVYRRR